MKTMVPFPIICTFALLAGSCITQSDTMAAIDRRAFNVQSGSLNQIRAECGKSGPVLKFEANQKNPWQGDIGKNKGRSELQSRYKLDYGKLYRVSYRVLVHSFDNKIVNRIVIGQFHQSSDKGDFAGHPPVEISLEDGKLVVFTAGDSNHVTPRPYGQILRASVPNFKLGIWHSIEASVIFSYSNSGFLEVKLDGKVVYRGENLNNAFNDDLGPYWKFGSYFNSYRNNFSTVKVDYKDLNFADVGGNPFSC